VRGKMARKIDKELIVTKESGRKPELKHLFGEPRLYSDLPCNLLSSSRTNGIPMRWISKFS
jgi:hypothetical protein